MTIKKTALVTGAAKGIGKAIVDKFISENYFVIAVDIDEASGIALVEEYDDQLIFVKADICNEHEIQNLFLKIKTEYKQLDVLVNNAGIIRDNMIWNMPVEDFDLVVNVNLKGTWLLCREAAKMMKAQNSGRIVNIASRAWLGNRGQSNYSASKAGVVSMTRVLALELGKYNVCVNAVAPGLIDTPLTQKLEENVLQKLIEAQPTRTMGKPRDVANAVAFLASDKTNFITGQTIYVDGGKSIGAGL
ncbi:MAG: SDR family NAD(P)-dependent oxidoreductase [Bacteroidota bacterium]